MKPLLEAGELVMTIPDKPNSKNQIYVAKKYLKLLKCSKSN